MPSEKKTRSNKINAQASIGPKSAVGKAVSSANARRHGILSQELMLPHEDPAEFDELLNSLISELGAQGTLERTLVERIAVAIWRQRRLVRAERQDIERQNEVIAYPLADTGDLQKKLVLLTDSELARYLISVEPSASNLDTLLQEVALLNVAPEMTAEQYARDYPFLSRICEKPFHRAATDTSAPSNSNTVERLKSVWVPVITEAIRQRDKSEAERTAWRAKSVPSDKEVLARYQAALDNEWYKAMRAFREARTDRLRTLDSV
jgi:hypothetical protein